MHAIETEPKFIYAAVTAEGRGIVSFNNLTLSTEDATDLLNVFAKAFASLQKQLNDYNAKQAANITPKARDPFERLNTSTRSVDIEDVNVGDQIRVGGWWHRVETINERRHGITIKTTRNKWFAFDHGDRVTIAVGAEDE